MKSAAESGGGTNRGLGDVGRTEAWGGRMRRRRAVLVALICTVLAVPGVFSGIASAQTFDERGRSVHYTATLTVGQDSTANTTLGYESGSHGSLSPDSFTYLTALLPIDRFGLEKPQTDCGTGTPFGIRVTRALDTGNNAWLHLGPSWIVQIGNKVLGFNDADSQTAESVVWCNQTASGLNLSDGAQRTVRISVRRNPHEVNDLKATGVYQGVQLRWTTPLDGGSSIWKHQYCVKTSPTDTCGDTNWTNIPNSAPGQGNDASYTIRSGLTVGTQYYFQIRAQNTFGHSAASNRASATPRSTRGEWRVDVNPTYVRVGGEAEAVITMLRPGRDTGGPGDHTFVEDVDIDLFWGGQRIGADDDQLLVGPTATLRAGEWRVVVKIKAPESKAVSNFEPPIRKELTARIDGAQIGSAGEFARRDNQDKPTLSLEVSPTKVNEGERIRLLVTSKPIKIAEDVEFEIQVGNVFGRLDEHASKVSPIPESSTARVNDTVLTGNVGSWGRDLFTVDNDENDTSLPLSIVLMQPDTMLEHYDLNYDAQHYDVDIVDDDPSEWTVRVGDAKGSEQGGKVDFVVLLDGEPTRRLEVKYTTESGTAKDGTDYQGTSGVLVWNRQDSEVKTVSVPVIDDDVEDSGETFTLKLREPAPADVLTISRAVATGTIYNHEGEEDETLTASFTNVPASHDGSGTFTMGLSFSVEPDITFKTLRDGAIIVTGGELETVQRNQRGNNQHWTLTVAPDSDADVTVELDATYNCEHPGAICTESGTMLENTPSVTVAGPPDVPVVVVPAISVGDATVEEGETASFTVSLSEPTSVDVSVDYEAESDSASRGSDFEASSGTLVFASGATSKTVSVATTEDADDEEDETFTLRLSNPQKATLDDATGTGTIEDDDEPPLTATFSEVPDEHDGADSSFTFHLDFSEAPEIGFRTLRDEVLQVTGGRAAKAQRRTSGSNQSWRITIEPAGAGDVTVRLPATSSCSSSPKVCTDDDRPLSNSVSATVRGPVGIAVADARVEEAAGAVLAFAVTLSRAPSGTVSVDYSTADGSAQAGTDYTGASGTLSFSSGETSKTIDVAVLDDQVDEGEETLTLRLSNASGGNLTDDEATGTIENHDALPMALVARFGRAAAVHVVEQVEQRMQEPPATGFEGRVLGQNIERGGEAGFAIGLLQQFSGNGWAPGTGAAGPGSSHGPLGAAGGGMGPAGSMPHGSGLSLGTPAPGMGGHGGGFAGGPGLDQMGYGPDVLTTSGFEAGREAAGGILSFWSRGARTHFAGADGRLGLNGDVRTTMLGADYRRGKLLTGVSLSHSRGIGDYSGAASGTVSSSVTGLYPWVGYRPSRRISVWALGGYGAGGLLLTRPEAGPQQSGLSLATTAAGTRGTLVEGEGGFELAFKADALWVGTRVHGSEGPHGNLAAAAAAVTRLRSALETSDTFRLGSRLSARPSLEVGIRQDGGDAEVGRGIDVGGGLAVADGPSGLQIDLRIRRLVMHQAEGFAEHGFSLAVSYDPRPTTPLGLRATVAPAWGGDARSGAEALWASDAMQQAGYGQAGGDRLDALVGYGLPLGSRLVGTPQFGVTTSPWGRLMRVGYTVGMLERGELAVDVGVDAQIRESAFVGGTEKGVLARAAIGW